MLTRVEVQNFKTFDDFAVDLDSFAVVLGPNAAGKSNLFDALRLLAALSVSDVGTAMQTVRGRAHELFRNPDRPLELACEVLLDPTVTDPFGQLHEVKNTRLRYEVAVTWSRGTNGVRPLVTHERVVRIEPRADRLRNRFVKSAVQPRYQTHKDYLNVVDRGGQPYFVVSQDGRQGRIRESPAAAATSTTLSTVRDATFLHLFALAEEFRSWRFLQFDPAVLRQPSDEAAPFDRLTSDGRNLARVLGRLNQNGDDRTVKEIATELNELVGGIDAISPRFADATRQWELWFSSSRDGEISARVVSDGTLRLTALLTAVLDPSARGLICFEEPENGVHPQRLRQLMQLLPEFTTDLVDPAEAPPLRQIVLNSHSPVVLAAVPSQSVLFADRVAKVGAGRTAPSYSTRLRRIERGLVATDDETVTEFEVQHFLEQAQPDHGA